MTCLHQPSEAVRSLPAAAPPCFAPQNLQTLAPFPFAPQQKKRKQFFCNAVGHGNITALANDPTIIKDGWMEVSYMQDWITGGLIRDGAPTVKAD
jgi:hypothetical protein